MEFDVVVVGAGAGGAAATWAFSKLGYKACLVDRGSYVSKTDYPANFSDWELRKNKEFSYDPNIRRNKSDYKIDNSKSPIKVANFNGIGGSTILYSGHFPRFHPSDFFTKSLDGVGSDWPISYELLSKYYDLNDKNMGISGLIGDPAYPDIKKLGKPVPLGSYGETIGKAFNKSGWHWWPSYAAISMTNLNNRNSCQNFGTCNSGCPIGAKASVDITYIPMALNLGAKIFSDAPVLDLISKKNEVKGIVARLNGVETPIFGKIVVLACNAVGSARLLLSHLRNLEYEVKGRISSQLGKNLMLHPLGYAEALLENPTDVSWGAQGCSLYSHEFYETRSESLFKRGYTLHLLRGSGPVEQVLKGLDRGDIKWGNSFSSDYEIIKNRYASMTVICEDLPNLSNQVYLTDKEDSDGLKVVGIKYKMDDNTKYMMSHGLGSAKKVLKNAGGKRIRVIGPVADAGWHLMGTMRMGKNNRSGVTSPIGEVYGLNKLFVADGSLFVTSSGVNPASTIQALALYVANQSSKKYLGEKDLLNDTI